MQYFSIVFHPTWACRRNKLLRRLLNRCPLQEVEYTHSPCVVIDMSRWYGIAYAIGRVSHIVTSRRKQYIQRYPEKTCQIFHDYGQDSRTSQLHTIDTPHPKPVQNIIAVPLCAHRSPLGQDDRDHTFLASSMGLSHGPTKFLCYELRAACHHIYTALHARHICVRR